MIGRASRWLMLLAAWLCVAIGIAGLVLPGVPGTVFLILAAWLFARSSPRFEHWLVNHPRYGPPVVRWRERGVIPARAKAIALGSMAVSAVVVWLTAPPAGFLVASLCLAASALYVGTRPSA